MNLAEMAAKAALSPAEIAHPYPYPFAIQPYPKNQFMN